jgi:hypothetical protein
MPATIRNPPIAVVTRSEKAPPASTAACMATVADNTDSPSTMMVNSP